MEAESDDEDDDDDDCKKGSMDEVCMEEVAHISSGLKIVFTNKNLKIFALISN